MSPSFPVGSFAWSSGLETAVEDGTVRDRESLVAWVRLALVRGAGRTDAMLLARAHEAVIADDEAALEHVVEQADVLRPTSELALESRQQGRAFLLAVAAGWPHPWFDRLQALLATTRRSATHAVAVGVASAVFEVPRASATLAWLHAYAANLVSAGVRLVPLGQTDGVRAMAALEPWLLEAARTAITLGWDDLGSATFALDLGSARHETQYTRLFRS